MYKVQTFFKIPEGKIPMTRDGSLYDGDVNYLVEDFVRKGDVVIADNPIFAAQMKICGKSISPYSKKRIFLIDVTNPKMPKYPILIGDFLKMLMSFTMDRGITQLIKWTFKRTSGGYYTVEALF